MEKLTKHVNGQWILEKADKVGNEKNQLGISDGKGKIKFEPTFGQKEFRQYVKQRADHMCETGYLAGTPDTWNWRSYWSVDHIEPLISIDPNDKIAIERITHFSNLRPITVKENCRKAARDKKWKNKKS